MLQSEATPVEATLTQRSLQLALSNRRPGVAEPMSSSLRSGNLKSKTRMEENVTWSNRINALSDSYRVRELLDALKTRLVFGLFYFMNH